MSNKYSISDFDNQIEDALSRSTADFYMPMGNNIISRLNDYYQWFELRNRTDTWQYSRIQKSRPGPVIIAQDFYKREIEGLNFASQDYLGLSSHPDVINAAREALLKYGPHSAGSPISMGHTDLVPLLENKLKELTGMEHVLIFPTGWAAGFGSLVGLVGRNDHVVMDVLSHACLSQGAYAASGKNVYKFDHLNNEAVRQILKDIRANDTRNGILVVSEGIFSMNSDTPDIRQLQDTCREFNATLLLDVAHDLGALGPQGSGQIGVQSMKGCVDLVMGSFSKSFASNGGFLATNSAAVVEYVKMYSGPYLYSNAISPIQTATVLQACNIIASPEGDMLRERLYQLSTQMRNNFHDRFQRCFGITSAVVPVLIGRESNARLVHSQLRKRNIAAMIVEFPIVPLGEARIRLQMMATHTIYQINHAVEEICSAINEAAEISQFLTGNNNPI